MASSDQALVSASSTQRLISLTGSPVWFPKTPLPSDEYVYVTAGIQQMIEDLSIHVIDGPADGLYVRWDLPKDPDDLWAALLDAASRSFYYGSKAQLQAQPVYVEAVNGLPLYQHFARIGSRPGRAFGFFVQAYGRRNLNPCECCERRYLQSYRPCDPDDSTSSPIHLLWPFFECISLAGFQNGRCGNCLYFLEGKKCSFDTEISEQYSVGHMRAAGTVPYSLPPRKLSRSTCKIVYTFDIQASVKAAKEAQEARVDVDSDPFPSIRKRKR